jgi:hypothetical protein
MHAIVIRVRNRSLTVRTLRSGDTGAVEAVLARLGPRARILRFGDERAVPPGELALLATADGDRHALIAYDGRTPIGIARLVRRTSDRAAADIVVAVTAEWHDRRVVTALLERIAADARAVGITRLFVSTHPDERATVTQLWRASRIERRVFAGGRIDVVARAT